MRIVPHDKGDLENSGTAAVNGTDVAKSNRDGTLSEMGKPPAAIPGSKIVGEVGYNKPYAARQHEELSYQHKDGRQAKYLENPLKEFTQQFVQNIADAVKKVNQ
jgi:hypothetical protein